MPDQSNKKDESSLKEYTKDIDLADAKRAESTGDLVEHSEAGTDWEGSDPVKKHTRQKPGKKSSNSTRGETKTTR